MRSAPRTRAERAGKLETAVDPDTGKEYVTARSRSGRLLDKNRSDDWRGYKSHLTLRQKKIIAYALRQLDRGCIREQVWIKIQPYWNPSPMQYPLTERTLQSWVMIRAANRARGKEWPLPNN
jgi:hypothetical protein